MPAATIKKKLLIASLATIVASLLGATLIEVAMRVQYAHWRETFDENGWLHTLTTKSADPILMWGYRPSTQTVRDGISYATNAAGFRGRDLPQDTTGKKRVALIGDSIVFGLGVRDEDTLASRLEAALPDVDVLNFGVDGYNAVQVAELLKTRVLACSPDVVVYVYCANDFDFDSSAGNKSLYFNKPRSFFLRSLRRAWASILGTEFHHLHFQRHRQIVYEDIVAMRDLVEKSGRHFVVAMVPIFPRTSFDPYPLADMDDDLERFLVGKSIAHVNLLPAFRATGLSPRALASDLWHPNERGHQLIATTLQPMLAEMMKP